MIWWNYYLKKNWLFNKIVSNFAYKRIVNKIQEIWIYNRINMKRYWMIYKKYTKYRIYLHIIKIIWKF